MLDKMTERHDWIAMNKKHWEMSELAGKKVEGVRIYGTGCDASRRKGKKLVDANEMTWWSVGECMGMEKCVAAGCHRA